MFKETRNSLKRCGLVVLTVWMSPAIVSLIESFGTTHESSVRFDMQGHY